jgi:hypothetical protein
MMSDSEVTQELYEQLLDDARWLQDEAEAVRYVIEQVPYKEKPPKGHSIFEMLRLLDHAQTRFYRPIIEKVFSENRTVKLSDYEDFRESFEELTNDKEHNVDKVLRNIIKHRGGILSILKKIPLIDWERELMDKDGERISLFDFSLEMVRTDRQILKDIADLILIHQNETFSRREVNARAEQRKSENK